MTTMVAASLDLGPHATRARLEVGDPLRALAALAVFGVHLVGGAVEASGYAGQLGRDHFASLFGFLGYGFDSLNSGVAVFFVLSGYLLSRPFLRAFIADQPMPSIPAYLRNRGLRILPAFWVVLCLAFLLYGTRGDTFWESVGLAAFITNFKASGMHVLFGQPWSLAVEVRFYLFLPLAALALMGLKRVLGPRLKRWTRIALVLALVGVGFEASADYAVNDAPYYDSFAANANLFAAGIILAVLEHVLPRRVRGRAWARRAGVAMFVGGLALTLSSQYFYVNHVLPTQLVRYLLPLCTGLIVAGPLLWQWSGGRAWRALDNGVLRWIGERSYSLFLVHSLVLFGLAPHLVAGGYKVTLVTLGCVGLACSLLAAAVLYRFVEQPALRRKVASPGSVGRTVPAPQEALVASTAAR